MVSVLLGDCLESFEVRKMASRSHVYLQRDFCACSDDKDSYPYYYALLRTTKTFYQIFTFLRLKKCAKKMQSINCLQNITMNYTPTCSFFFKFLYQI